MFLISWNIVLRLFKMAAVLQTWTEVCHELFAGRKMQTIRNLSKNSLLIAYSSIFPLWALRQNDSPWSGHTGKEKVPGAAVNKESHAGSLLCHEGTHHYRFPWKRCKFKQFIHVPIPSAIFHLIYWMNVVYI